MATLLTEEHGLLLGALLRPLYEVWLTGFYSLLGGLDAIEVLLDARDIRLRPLRRAFQLPDDPSLPSGKHLSVRKLAERVHELAATQRDLAPFFDALRLYDALYALDSYDSVHGGLGVIGRHLLASTDAENPDYSIVLKPAVGGMGCQRLTFAGLLTIDLARPVWRLGGIGDDALERLDADLRAANHNTFYGPTA